MVELNNNNKMKPRNGFVCQCFALIEILTNEMMMKIKMTRTFQTKPQQNRRH